MKTKTEKVPAGRKHVEYTLEVLPETVPVEGNASATGDDELDRATERGIIKALEHGEEWAWCTVKVTAKYSGFEGSEYLGCCSYESEKDFKASGYYDDMKAEALCRLESELKSANKTAHKYFQCAL